MIKGLFEGATDFDKIRYYNNKNKDVKKK